MALIIEFAPFGPLPLIHNALVTLVADTSERHSVPLVLKNIVLRLSMMGLVYRQ